ncbi:MAG TPA: hypothetical protein VFS46_04885 [Nitrososphaera sp.]|nr:hypothetical protein [Nitrososphaera sp.]
MAEPGKKDKRAENVFRIMDEIVHQLNKTKRMFILMIVSFIIVVPATHIITVALVGETIFDEGGPPFDRSGPPDNPAFRAVQAVVIGTVLVWIGIGVRQWFVLSKWTKKYRQYKELQKKIDEKLDYDEDDEKQP